MKSVKSQDINVLFVGIGEQPSDRQLRLFNILKAREANEPNGKFKVIYEQLTGKIQGNTLGEVYIDESLQS